MCDYYVRELAQREEALKEKGRTLRKLRNADEDEARLQKLDEEQEALRKNYWYQEWQLYNWGELYNWQCSIPSGPINLAYECIYWKVSMAFIGAVVRHK
ncbi:hypothetical protein N7501_006058 [Penicillium viridicatum]|nr:hypothetical protein N7501_006058 [Penicillium viridicatum]